MSMPKSQQSWVRSQHPPTQWNLRGAADEAVLNTVHRKKKKENPKNPPVKSSYYSVFNSRTLYLGWVTTISCCSGCTYDLYSLVHNVLDACISITRASGRGLSPGNEGFLGPVKWHRADRRVPFGAQRAQKTRDCGGRGLGQTRLPPPLPHVMYLPASKTLRYVRGHINHRCINCNFNSRTLYLGWVTTSSCCSGCTAPPRTGPCPGAAPAPSTAGGTTIGASSAGWTEPR